jgi:hypothetical protein
MCYRFRSFYNENAMFSTIDATYVVHLKGNGRYENIKDQLNRYPLTKHVHVLMNQGYKKCDKPGIDSPAIDLIDAFKYCMNHAKKYDTILILEDDFIVHEDIHDHVDNINNFVENNTDFIYRLGCIPYIMFPYDINNYKGFSTGSHAVIYSNSVRNKIMNSTMNDWDIFLNFHKFNYIYHKPIIYQLFPHTENASRWGEHNIVVRMFGYIIHKLLILVNLHNEIEPGYSIFYIFAKYFYLLLVIFIFYKNVLRI